MRALGNSSWITRMSIWALIGGVAVLSHDILFDSQWTFGFLLFTLPRCLVGMGAGALLGAVLTLLLRPKN